MSVDPQKTFSLTGPQSHLVQMPAGQGSFSLGPAGSSGEVKLDAIVPADAVLNWSAFEGETTPAGTAWPRVFYYWGNDTSFGNWSATRPVETFRWYPQKGGRADFSTACISQLHVTLGSHAVALCLGPGVKQLYLTGDLSGLTVLPGSTPNMLGFSSHNAAHLAALPRFSQWAMCANLDVTVSPIGPVFDCSHLKGFKSVQDLSLYGNMANLEVLESFSLLEYLKIQSVPLLTGLPLVQSWPCLKSLLAFDIEAVGGERLQQNIKALPKERLPAQFSVKKLRAPLWFAQQYQNFFSHWPSQKGRLAAKIFKETITTLSKAASALEVEHLIQNFAGIVASISDGSTTARESIAEAVVALAKHAAPPISASVALAWIEAHPDY